MTHRFALHDQITGDYSWVEAGINSLAEQCLTQVEKNVNLWVVSSGILLPDPSIINGICLNDCSGKENGECDEGRQIIMYDFTHVSLCDISSLTREKNLLKEI